MGDENPFGINDTKRYVSFFGEKELFREYQIGSSGSVELVDYIGGDETVERVATAGHGVEILGLDIPENSLRMRVLHNLVKRGIYQPFRSVQLKFSIQAPIEVALDLVYNPRAKVNEYSLRYSEALETSHEEDVSSISAVLTGTGLSDEKSTERSEAIYEILKNSREESFEKYRELIEKDMARELARSNLSITQDTRFFWRQDLVDLIEFTRNNKSRVSEPYSSIINKITQRVAPNSWESFNYNNGDLLNLDFLSDSDIVDGSLSPASWKPGKTKRRVVKELEEKLFLVEKVLDHGEFQIVDYMGDDNSMAEAARTSYGEGTKSLQDNENLIRSLIRDSHTTPIEMAQLAFESKAPVFSDPRQAGRHRTLHFHGFMGLTPIGDQYYSPGDSEFKYQDRINRQGRGKDMDPYDLEACKRIFRDSMEAQLDKVKQLREIVVPEELIRKVKGVGFYTKIWRTGDTHNLAKYLSLRNHSHAQMEIREYAKKVDEAVKLHTPIAHQAFKDYVFEGMRLSRMEVEQIGKLITEGRLTSDIDLEDMKNFQGQGWIIPIDKEDPSKGKKLGREGEAFKDKLKRLNN